MATFKTLEEFFDAIAIDIGTLATKGRITVVASVLDKRPEDKIIIYKFTWAYRGNGSLTFSQDAGVEYRKNIQDELEERAQYAAGELKQCALNSVAKKNKIIIKRAQFYGEEAARVLNSLGPVTSPLELAKIRFGQGVSEASGQRFDTADLYVAGAKHRLKPEDVLARIKEFYAKQE
jgi:hypothetical protein